MSKNLTRKGLAFGALVALGASVIAGTPAQAATPLASAITTTSTHGTGSIVIEGTDFEVTTAIAADYAYYNTVTGAFNTVATEDYEVCTLWADNDYLNTGADPDAWVDVNDTCIDDEIRSLTSAEVTAIGVHSQTVDGEAESAGELTDVAVISGALTGRWVSTAGKLEWSKSSDATYLDVVTDSASQFSIAPIAADTTVTFTPYLDIINNDAKDVSEPSGAAFAVTFLNNTGTVLSAALSTSVQTPTTADLSAKVTGPAGVNLDQMNDDLELRAYKASTEIDDPSFDDEGNVSWDDMSVGYYTARVFSNAPFSTTAYSALSNQVIIGQVSTDAAITGIEHVDQADANVTTREDVREGTKSVSVKTQILKGTGPDQEAYAKAGVSVKYYVKADGGNNVDTALKVNGVALSSITDGTVVTTNASGIAEITVTTSTGSIGDEFDVYAVVLTSGGSANTGMSCDIVTYEWVDAVAKNIYEVHDTENDTNGNDGVVGVVKGGTVTLNYEVTDNFGQPLNLAGETFRVVVTDSHHHALVSVPAIVENGRATVSFTETRNAGTNYDVEAELQRSVDGSNWYRDVHCIEEPDTDIYVGTTLNVGAVSASIDQAPTYLINTSEFANLNKNTVQEENTLVDINDSNDISVSGVVVDANNVPIAGAPVVISLARGGMFDVETDDSDISSIAPVTVYTDANGAYGIEFVTHFAGVNTVNVVAGGKSATATATVANPTAANSTDVLTVSTSAAVSAGTVTPVSVKLVDKFGNGIQGQTVKLDVSGNGYLSVYSVITSNGSASALLINGVSDAGNSVITATAEAYSPDKVATTPVATGSTAIVKAASTIKGRIYVVVENSINETVRIYANGKFVKSVVANSNRFVVQLNGFKTGEQKLSVTSNFQRLFTGTVTTK